MTKSNNKKSLAYIISFLVIILIDIWLIMTHYRVNNGQFDTTRFGNITLFTVLIVVFFSTVPVFVASALELKEADHEDFEVITDKIFPKMPYYIALLFIPMSLFFA